MMCYRDITFCKFYESCRDGHKCHKALTPQVLEDAERWMTNAPIAVWSQPPEKCYMPKETTNVQTQPDDDGGSVLPT